MSFVEQQKTASYQGNRFTFRKLDICQTFKPTSAIIDDNTHVIHLLVKSQGI